MSQNHKQNDLFCRTQPLSTILSASNISVSANDNQIERSEISLEDSFAVEIPSISIHAMTETSEKETASGSKSKKKTASYMLATATSKAKMSSKTESVVNTGVFVSPPESTMTMLSTN